METHTLDYDYLAQRVGAVTIGWSNLEAHLKAFLYDLASYHAAAFEGRDDAFHVLVVLFSNMEARQSIANAKALAHGVKDIPEFYERVETLLNWIDNDLRNERNRYVHDVWRMWGPVIHRIKSGVIVRRQPSTGERTLLHSPARKYLGTAEMKKLADQLKDAVNRVEALGQELRDKLNETRPRPE